MGPPHIFHTDNGREFVNALLHSLLDRWSSGNVTFVNGRPRHSQSQGLVERGNRVIQDKIKAIKNDEGYNGESYYAWASWLPRIMFNMNTQHHTTIQDMPYKLVFGQAALVPNAEKQIVLEEDIESVTSVSATPSTASTVTASTTSTHPTASPQHTVANTSTTAATAQQSPKTWVVQKQRVLTWNTSPVSSPTEPAEQPVVSLQPTTTEQPEPAEVDPIIICPAAAIPQPVITSSDPGILLVESPFREGPSSCKCKEPESPDTIHENIRKKARNETAKSAVKMANYYNKTKCTLAYDFKQGDMVSFLVPKIDRSNTDMPRIPGVILAVSGGDNKVLHSWNISRHNKT